MKESFLKAIRGQESVRILFLRWYLGINLIAIFFGGLAGLGAGDHVYLSLDPALFILVQLVFNFFGILGIIFIVIYPAVFCYSLWVCSKRYSKLEKIMYRMCILPFLFIHYFVGGVALAATLEIFSSFASWVIP